MGNLKPSANYIYERVNGVTYAREFGADPATRIEVGWDYDPRTTDGKPLMDSLMEAKLWGDIHRTAKTNSALHNALQQCILIYTLTEDYEKRYGSKT
jgi:hypothetical protein